MRRTRTFGLLASLLLVGTLLLWNSGSLEDDARGPAALENTAARGRVLADQGLSELRSVSRSTASERDVAEVQPLKRAASVESLAAPKPTLFGQVLDAAGNAVRGATVVLAELNEQGSPKGGGGRAHVQSNDTGEFALEVPAWALDQEILLAARHVALRPYSEITRLDTTRLASPEQLTLGFGSELLGRVLRDGLPVSGVRISVDAKYLTSGVHGMSERDFFSFYGLPDEAWWEAGRLEEKTATTWTNAEGSFHLRGMGNGEFRLHIGVPGGSAPSTHEHVYVARPGEFQIYELSLSTLSITVQDDWGFVSGAQVHVVGESRRIEFKSAEEPTLVNVEPLESLLVEVRHGGHRDHVVQVHAPARGQTLEVVVDLKRVERPSLRVSLAGAQKAGVDWVQLSLRTGDTSSPFGGPVLASFQVQRSLDLDLFEVQAVNLDPGEYLLVLEALEQGGPNDCVKTSVQPVWLPELGVLAADLDLQLWAKFQVDVSLAARPGVGASTTITKRLLDLGGNELVRFESNRYRMGNTTFEEGAPSFADQRNFGWRFDGGWKPSDSSPSYVWGLLPAGKYQLEVKATGHKAWRQAITLEGAKKTDLNVFMSAKTGD